MTLDLFLEILGFCVGLAYLYWEYQADAKVWLASIVMPAISMWIYFSKGLYADFGINIYYLLIAVYGFIVWTGVPRKKSSAPPSAKNLSLSHSDKSKTAPPQFEATGKESAEGNTPSVCNAKSPSGNPAESSSLKSEETSSGNPAESSSDIISETESGKSAKAKHPITRLPLTIGMACTGATLLLWGAIWWILVSFTDSTVPVADAFTTALSIVGLWMMARKYAEQWLAWLIVDIVCSGLYFYKGLPFYCILYAIYSVIAIFGYRKWLRLIPTQSPA